MDKSEYDSTMATLSGTSTYEILQTDSTSSLQREMNGQLLQLKKGGSLTTCQYNILHCSSGSTPSIYMAYQSAQI